MLTVNREDMYAPDSIELLQKSGLDFQRHEEFGILPNDFAELMITSGLVLNPENKWISFHRCVATQLGGSSHSYSPEAVTTLATS